MPSKRVQGVGVEVVKCAISGLQLPYDIQLVPWARAQKMVEQGDADGFFAGSRNAERDAYAVLSAPIAEVVWRWYLRADSPADPKAPEFRNSATTASMIGTTMLDWLRSNGYKVDQSAALSTEVLLKMLLRGRIDAILANDLAMEQLISEQGVNDKLRSVLQESRPIGVYFSKKFLADRAGFLEKFNGQVVRCRATKP